MFSSLEANPVTPDVGRGIVDEYTLRQRALKLSEAAFRVSQGQTPWETVESLYEAFNHTPAMPDVEHVDMDLEHLVSSVYSETGLRWRLQCLNKSLGSLRDGDFGFIFARPETGKTTFLADTASFMLEQPGDDRPVVWFNNEEAGNKVGFRFYQAFFGVTTQQLLSNIKKYRDTFMSKYRDKFILIDRATISRHEVEKILGKYNPKLVIYDQLTKIKGFKADRTDLQLGEIFQWARELAKNSHAAIGVSQADGTAEGVRYLTMEHVANAKTAVQAEADWILGIGKDHSMGKARFLNISKNKLLQDADSDPELRHGRFEVLLEPSIARYEDVIRFDK